jgi:hypothetical protein
LRALHVPRSELVCLVAGPLSRASERALASSGWALARVPTVANPAQGDVAAFGAARHPAKLARVYSKLAVFNLTAYARVVYLDADTLVVPPGADALFRCRGALCAALRHSERFNSGVMVLAPRAATARNMSALLSTLPSYTGCAACVHKRVCDADNCTLMFLRVCRCARVRGDTCSGDQGFLNAYFAALPGAPLFDPDAAGRDDDADDNSADDADCDGGGDEAAALWRLPTRYNADVGLYVLNRRARGEAPHARCSQLCVVRARGVGLMKYARVRLLSRSNRWPLPRESLRVLHFTLGPLKPWQWWAPWLVPAAAEWQAVRARTPGAAVLLGAGAPWRDALGALLRLAAPWLALGASHAATQDAWRALRSIVVPHLLRCAAVCRSIDDGRAAAL